MMSQLCHICLLVAVAILLSVMIQSSLAVDNGNGLMKSLPFWKSQLVQHRKWSGYYNWRHNRFMCSLQIYSVQYSKQGVCHASFVSDDTHFEMTGFSNDDHTVVFKETHVWNKTWHFLGQTEIVFTGTFHPEDVYYKFEANISSKETPDFGTIILVPRASSTARPQTEKKGDVALALAIAVPMLMGFVCLSLAALIILWAVRKGYLRHVPWKYSTFRNPTAAVERRCSDVEMISGDRAKPGVPVEGVQASDLHI